MNPACGSNLYAMGADHSGLAIRARRGGKGWQPWRRADGWSVEETEAGREIASSFWLNEQSQNGGSAADVEFDSYSNRARQTVKYISQIDSYWTEKDYDRPNKEFSETGWKLRIDMRCDRLLVVQNASCDKIQGTLDFSHGVVKWFAPRKGAASGVDGFGARPWRAPSDSVDGEWAYRDKEEVWRSKDYGTLWCIAPKWGESLERQRDWAQDKWDGGRRHGLAMDTVLEHALTEGGNTPEELDMNRWGDIQTSYMLYSIGGNDTDGWYPIWWKECNPADSRTTVEHFSLSALYDGMRGRDPYEVMGEGGEWESCGVCFLDRVANDDMLADVVEGAAFDLLVYFRTFHYYAELISNPEHQHRGYFNTQCRAKVRVVAPVPPA